MVQHVALKEPCRCLTAASEAQRERVVQGKAVTLNQCCKLEEAEETPTATLS